MTSAMGDYRTQFLGYIPPPMPGQPNMQAQTGAPKPDGYNPYAAGPKMYGAAGRTNPTSGPVSPEGLEGYAGREQRANVHRQAALNLLKANQSGSFASPEWLGGQASGH